MVDVCVMNIFHCNADLCEFPHTQEGVFGKSVISAESMYTLPARKKYFPMSGVFGVAIYQSRCFQEYLVTLVQVLQQSQLTEDYVSET